MVQGFAIVALFMFALQIYGILNKAIPTGLTYTGAVVELAASSTRRGQESLALVKLENGHVLYISYRGRYIGESLDFTEYQHKLTGKHSYHLNSQ